jgi:hypothetical protein
MPFWCRFAFKTWLYAINATRAAGQRVAVAIRFAATKDGGLARSCAALAIKAAAMGPARWALRPMSSAKASKIPPLFRQRYTRIGLDESRMVVSSGAFVTAGAALAHIDLALGLIRRQSPALAALTARYLLIEPRASQAIFMIPDHLAHSDPLVERFERWARRHLRPSRLDDISRSNVRPNL